MTEVQSHRQGVVESSSRRAAVDSAMAAAFVMTMRRMEVSGVAGAVLPLGVVEGPAAGLMSCAKLPLTPLTVILAQGLAGLAQHTIPAAVVAAFDPVPGPVELARQLVFPGDGGEQCQGVEVPVDDGAAPIESPIGLSRLPQRGARRVVPVGSYRVSTSIAPTAAASRVRRARQGDRADQQGAQGHEPHHGPSRRMHRVSSMRCFDSSVRAHPSVYARAVDEDQSATETFPS